MPVFSFEKIKNADTSLGPEMKSTGEVLGISKDYLEAIAKAFAAANVNIPKKGNVLITVRDKDKPEMLKIAGGLYKLGFKVYSTSGTAKFLSENGIQANAIPKLWEGEDNIAKLIEEEKLSFIINTPTKGKNASRDGFRIRRLAVECKVPCFTSLDTAKAFFECIQSNLTDEDLVPIDITKI